MLDIQFIKENQKAIAEAIVNKGVDADLPKLLNLDQKRRALIAELEGLRQQRRQLASDSGRQSSSGAKDLKSQIAILEERLVPIEADFAAELYKVPNLPSSDTPVGQSEAENKTIYSFGEKPEFDFKPKPHWEMSQFFDEPRAVRLSGARFTFLKGDFVLLQLALIQYGLDILTDEGILRQIIKKKKLSLQSKPFLPILPPTMMRTQPYLATNRLQLKGDTFKLADDDLWLTGSAEHTLCAYFMNETLSAEELPIRLVGYNTAYRREVGSAGKDTRGIIRQHQFDKLEMESFTSAADSAEEHEFMIGIQEYLMESLELHFKTVLKCTYDMGGPNIRGVDIETWMPGQGLYRETNSADYLGDFQARGLKTRIASEKGKEFAHTNDATVFCQRHLVAILENNQQADGRIKVPKILRPYMKEREFIGNEIRN